MPHRPSPHEMQYAVRGPVPPSTVPVKLWERLLSGNLTLSARFGLLTRGGAFWFAAPDENDPEADPLPCGLRLSIVRLAWEVGEGTYDLVGRAAPEGVALPFQRPKQLRDLQLSAQMGADRTCQISGFCQYEDVNLQEGVAEAGKFVAARLPEPEADWNAIWSGKAGKDALAAACRNILRLDGGAAIAREMADKPDRLPKASAAALASVLKEENGDPGWAAPFLTAGGPLADAALVGLAREPKEENQKVFEQWVAAPAGRSPESVQAACCALIDLGKPGSEVNALIDSHAVKAFPEVRQPSAVLAFPPQTAQTVLDWLLHNGTDSQRLGAAAAVAEGNIEPLRDAAREFANQLGAESAAVSRLCRALGKAKSPLAFEMLSIMAQRLAQSDAGDRFPPLGTPAALSSPAGPDSAGRFSRTVAGLVCAGLARCDKVEAGKVLVRLMQSPGPATRYCAIEALVALDDVDAAPDIRARFDVLSKLTRDAYEQQEWELLTPSKNKLCRYDVPLLSAKNAVKNGMNLKEAIETCDSIIKENPSPAVVEKARALKAEAEKLLQHAPGAAH
jgi:hypothetical protein